VVRESMDNYYGKFGKLTVSPGAVIQGVEGTFFGVSILSILHQCFDFEVKLTTLRIGSRLLRLSRK
jgi:hypothetical protein